MNYTDLKLPHFDNSVTILYYFTITSFYYIRTRERAKYESVLHCSKRIVLYHSGLKLLIEQNSKKMAGKYCSGIINLLLDGITDNSSTACNSDKI